MNWMCICGPHCGFRGAAPGGMLGVDAASRLRALRLCGTAPVAPRYRITCLRLRAKVRCLTQLAHSGACVTSERVQRVSVSYGHYARLASPPRLLQSQFAALAYSSGSAPPCDSDWLSVPLAQTASAVERRLASGLAELAVNTTLSVQYDAEHAP